MMVVTGLRAHEIVEVVLLSCLSGCWKLSGDCACGLARLFA